MAGFTETVWNPSRPEILYQDMTPTRLHPPVRIENHDALNRIHLQEPSLADYDTFVSTRRSRLEK